MTCWKPTTKIVLPMYQWQALRKGTCSRTHPFGRNLYEGIHHCCQHPEFLGNSLLYIFRPLWYVAKINSLRPWPLPWEWQWFQKWVCQIIRALASTLAWKRQGTIKQFSDLHYCVKSIVVSYPLLCLETFTVTVTAMVTVTVNTCITPPFGFTNSELGQTLSRNIGLRKIALHVSHHSKH